MSKSNHKKVEHRRKRHLQRQSQKQKKKEIASTSIPPEFPAEWLGAPASGAGWIGQKIAALLRPRKA